MDVALVRSTYDGEEDAWTAAGALVEAGLAACVHVQAIRSCYVWAGERQEDREWLLEARCLEEAAEEVVARLRSGHPYDTPLLEVLRSRVEDDYGQWMRSQRRPEGRPGA